MGNECKQGKALTKACKLCYNDMYKSFCFDHMLAIALSQMPLVVIRSPCPF